MPRLSDLKLPYRCPKCGAPPDKHGAGFSASCKARKQLYRDCIGLVCLCDSAPPEKAQQEIHGRTFLSPCPNAKCDHCGWAGTLPHIPTDKAVLPYEEEALRAGWNPPGHRLRSLGWSGHGGSRWGRKGGTKPTG